MRRTAAVLCSKVPLRDAGFLPPRLTVDSEKRERILRHQEIWADKESIVHRLPTHYKRRYWEEYVLADRAPVHFEPPTERYWWDTKRNMWRENKIMPIIPLETPERAMGLWAGEGVVKGYRISNPFIRKKILPRNWVPRFWFPNVKQSLLHSEVLDRYMWVQTTERALRQIDEHFGLDLYLLETPEIDVSSKLGMRLKREILVRLATADYYEDNKKKRDYIKRKYQKFVIPAEEAAWVGMDLNEASRKLQDKEEKVQSVPKKYTLEEKYKEELMVNKYKKEQQVQKERRLAEELEKRRREGS